MEALTYKTQSKPNFLISLLQNRCPRCRQGGLFKYHGAFRIKGLMAMHESCSTCGQPLDMEPGFYYGTNMISYALAVTVSVISFFIWWLLIGFSLHDNRFFYWIAFNAILLVFLQPPLMRWSRTIWLSIFVKYSADWDKGDIVAPFSVNKEQAANW